MKRLLCLLVLMTSVPVAGYPARPESSPAEFQIPGLDCYISVKIPLAPGPFKCILPAPPQGRNPKPR